MRGPGIPANATREQLVNNLDVVATILDVAGAAPGVVPVGRSLSPLFADANAPWRSTLLIQSPVNRYAPTRHRYRGVRTTTRKYVKYDGGFRGTPRPQRRPPRAQQRGSQRFLRE